MRTKYLAAGAMIAALGFGQQASANQIGFRFGGAGVSGSGVLTFDPTHPDAISGGDPITGISGTFSDANTVVPISNAAITGVFAVNPVVRPPPFPANFSVLAVTNPPPMDAAISYDNLFYPDGSPITCDGYLFFGGFLDVYGVMFQLNNGDLVDLFSNGNFSNGNDPATESLIYGAVVMDTSMDAQNSGEPTVIDNVSNGIAAGVPEPSSLWLLGTFLLGAAGWRRRSATSRAARG